MQRYSNISSITILLFRLFKSEFCFKFFITFSICYMKCEKCFTSRVRRIKLHPIYAKGTYFIMHFQQKVFSIKMRKVIEQWAQDLKWTNGALMTGCLSWWQSPDRKYCQKWSILEGHLVSNWICSLSLCNY